MQECSLTRVELLIVLTSYRSISTSYSLSALALMASENCKKFEFKNRNQMQKCCVCFCCLAGFWVLGSGFWVLGSGFWVLGSGFWVLGSGFWVLGSGFWVLVGPIGYNMVFTHASQLASVRTLMMWKRKFNSEINSFFFI
jgi:hypothetical protein